MSANVMTREQKLYSMRIVDLVEVAEKLGVKIDKKGKKSVAVQKILDAEQNVAGDGTPLADVGKEIAQQAKEKAEKHTKSILKKASKTTEKKANKKAENNGPAPIDVALSVCKSMKLDITTAKNNVGIKKDGKRTIDMWGRKECVRVYVNAEYEQYKTLDKKLYVIKGQGSGKLNVSMYVDTANIEAVIKHLIGA